MSGALLTMDAGLSATREELLVAMPYGAQPGVAPLPVEARTPRAALEAAIGDELRRGLPCFVLFSGGRDSSTLLAVAARVARREGLPLPVPVSQIYPGFADADEHEWQELVVRHLGLDDWVRVDRRGAHEMFGAVAADAVRRHGVQFPAVWWTSRLPEEVGGLPMPGASRIAAPPISATLLTGLGGDELFLDSPRPLFDALLQRRFGVFKHPRRLAAELTPAGRRARAMAHEFSDDLAWIVPERRLALGSAPGAYLGGIGLDYRSYLEALHHDRGLRVARESDRVAAAESGARTVEPLLDPRLISALVRRYGRRWPPGRTEALRELVGDLLPAAVIERTTKGDVTEPFLGEESIAWLEAWDGATPDPEVDGVEARRLLLLAARGEEGRNARPSHAAQRAFAAQLGVG